MVALRKESVDRNRVFTTIITICIASLSARRAWIEIDIPPNLDADNAVALRKESVDRNIHAQNLCVSIIRRSPQGERG